MILRIVSNFVYFVGRYNAKEGPIEDITSKAPTYMTRIIWLKENEQELIKLLENKLLK